jgi:hypothetical protein
VLSSFWSGSKSLSQRARSQGLQERGAARGRCAHPMPVWKPSLWPSPWDVPKVTVPGRRHRALQCSCQRARIDIPYSDPRGTAGTECHPPSHSSVCLFETSQHFFVDGVIGELGLSLPRSRSAYRDPRVPAPQESDVLFMSPNTGPGHTTARRRRPGIRSETALFARRQPGVGFPHLSGCPLRPEFFAGVCSSSIWASLKPGNSERNNPAEGVRFTVARSHMGSSGYKDWVDAEFRFASQRTQSRCRRSLHVFKRGDTHIAPIHLAMRASHAPSCLAPGERGEHATPTIPRRQDPSLLSPSPFSPPFPFALPPSPPFHSVARRSDHPL